MTPCRLEVVIDWLEDVAETARVPGGEEGGLAVGLAEVGGGGNSSAAEHFATSTRPRWAARGEL